MKVLRVMAKEIYSVHINVTPQELSGQQKEFFENMLEHENFLPKPTDKEKSFFDKVKDMFT
ncbi:MAG: hypothetical protein U5K51_16225 [Flavobacteriaceae bacterium]|nr:hypothetical protein [Flavobacteriaceae bacterium]